MIPKEKYPNIIFHAQINVSYCVYYPSNIFRNVRRFENWGISLKYFPVQLVQSCDHLEQYCEALEPTGSWLPELIPVSVA